MQIKNSKKAQMLFCLVLFSGSGTGFAQTLKFFTDLGIKNSPLLKKKSWGVLTLKKNIWGRVFLLKIPGSVLATKIYLCLPGLR